MHRHTHSIVESLTGFLLLNRESFRKGVLSNTVLLLNASGHESHHNIQTSSEEAKVHFVSSVVWTQWLFGCGVC